MPVRRYRPDTSGVSDDVLTVIDTRRARLGAFGKAYEAWKKEVIGTWGWKGIQTDVGVNPIVAVQDITKADLTVLLSTKAEHGLVVGDTFQLAKVRSARGRINGVYKVATRPTATSLTFTARDDKQYTYSRDGGVQKRSYGVLTIEEIFLRGVTEKKRGDSVQRRRGRRKTRPS